MNGICSTPTPHPIKLRTGEYFKSQWLHVAMSILAFETQKRMVNLVITF